jgi:hypothetical protein
MSRIYGVYHRLSERPRILYRYPGCKPEKEPEDEVYQMFSFIDRYTLRICSELAEEDGCRIAIVEPDELLPHEMAEAFHINNPSEFAPMLDSDPRMLPRYHRDDDNPTNVISHISVAIINTIRWGWYPNLIEAIIGFSETEERYFGWALDEIKSMYPEMGDSKEKLLMMLALHIDAERKHSSFDNYPSMILDEGVIFINQLFLASNSPPDRLIEQIIQVAHRFRNWCKQQHKDTE